MSKEATIKALLDCLIKEELDALPVVRSYNWCGTNWEDKDLGSPEYQELGFRQENAQHITDILEEFCLNHDSNHLFHEAQKIDMVWAPVVAPYGSLSNEHLNETIKYPGRPYLFSKGVFENNTAAPLLGQDNNRIYSNLLGLTKENPTLLKQAHVV